MKDGSESEKSRHAEIVIKGMNSRSFSISYLKIQIPWVVIAAILVTVATANHVTPCLMNNAGQIVESLHL